MCWHLTLAKRHLLKEIFYIFWLKMLRQGIIDQCQTKKSFFCVENLFCLYNPSSCSTRILLQETDFRSSIDVDDVNCCWQQRNDLSRDFIKSKGRFFKKLSSGIDKTSRTYKIINKTFLLAFMSCLWHYRTLQTICILIVTISMFNQTVICSAILSNFEPMSAYGSRL